MCTQCEKYFEQLKQAHAEIGWQKARAERAEKKLAEVERKTVLRLAA